MIIKNMQNLRPIPMANIIKANRTKTYTCDYTDLYI